MSKTDVRMFLNYTSGSRPINRPADFDEAGLIDLNIDTKVFTWASMLWYQYSSIINQRSDRYFA